MKNNSRVITTVLAMLLLSSCAAIQPSQTQSVSSSKVAVLKGLPGWNPLSVVEVKIFRIDGKKVSSRNSRFEVSPGEHRFEVRCSREQPEPVQRYFVFEMYLKAGHEYKPQIDMMRECHVDYIDISSGKKYQALPVR